MTVHEIPSQPARTGRPGLLALIGVLVLLLIGARAIAQIVIEYAWWNEVGQVETWQSIILYAFAPIAIATLVAFAILWTVHARALKFAGTSLGENRVYARISSLALFIVSLLIARGSLDNWTTVSYYGSIRAGAAPDAWRDPIFGHALSFYLFELPFYTQAMALILAISFVAAVVFFVAWQVWRVLIQRPQWREGMAIDFDISDLSLTGAFHSFLLRVLVAIVLIAFAARAWLGRYTLLDDDHGFLVGVDYLAQWVTLPLQWVSVGAFLVAGLLVLINRPKLAALPIVLVGLKAIVPPIVSAVHVKPNEITLQKPYIQHHIAATRAAYGLDNRLKEIAYPAKLEAPIDPVKNAPLLENVRLWDWRAFHDTVTQIQALRQYYVFSDTDVDRYMIDGKLRQVMLTPRELDIQQMPDARSNWINGHFIYTHGYGMVMAEANRITSNGQPVLIVQDAPPKISTPSLKLTRPEIYYGEVTHEPVFVRTDQPEFNYPSGADNVHTKYDGRGGLSIGTLGKRVTAALALADRNLLLTGYLNSESRMMINRNVRQRVSKLASFIEWDGDPYLVLTDEGRLVWVIDGYTTSDRHPYSRRFRIEGIGSLNYIRNSVKATVDAYDGTVSMYVFEPNDPVIRAFNAMFPELFRPASEMPADIRLHTRYPELIFRTQAEIYRTFHMLDAEAFYNREDLWDIGRNVTGQSKQPEALPPSFVVATLPGETTAEFLLVQSFTPRNKDNLIGLMVARSDGEHLGELVVLQLSKQSLIYGPLQIEARIDSDAEISKDLSLWNQQGSQVLRGHMLVLPISDTFLYVQPIYIQSAQARMPQLKKVVLAMGNTIVYRDTYEQALAALVGGGQQAAPAPAPTTPAGTSSAPPPPAPAPADPRVVETIRGHLQRYRQFSAQGKWAEAGRELEALERLVNR